MTQEAQEASPALEAFIDESIRRSEAKKYYPTKLQSMRVDLGTKPAIIRLILSGGEPQSGFRRMQEIDLLDWSLEAAVLQFPEEFSKDVLEVARWRLDQARAGIRT